MLQVGGEQEAVIAAAPACAVEMVQAVPAAHPVVPPAEIAAGEDDTQVSGGLGTMQPCTSTAMAVMLSVLPLVVTKLVSLLTCSPFRLSSIAMHCTGQVSKKNGWLDTPEAEATICVCPGTAGPAVASFVGTAGLFVVTEMIGVILVAAGLTSLQVNGPTAPVMSFPLSSRAVACKVSIWFCERQPR